MHPIGAETKRTSAVALAAMQPTTVRDGLKKNEVGVVGSDGGMRVYSVAGMCVT